MRVLVQHASFLRGLIVGAVLLGLAVPATTLAGSGLGAVFNLGSTNTVNRTSVLRGSTASAELQVTNTGTGPALKLTTKPGTAPLQVSSTTKVVNLNADRLDGLNSTAFRKTADAVDAATLDGLDSTAFRKTADAVDAATLDGLDSTAFRKTADAVDAATLGGVAAAGFVGSPSGASQALLRGRLTEPLGSGNGAILSVAGFGSIEGSCGSGGVPNYRLFWRNGAAGQTVDAWHADPINGVAYASIAPNSGFYVAPLDLNVDRVVTVTEGLSNGATVTVTVSAHAGATGCVFTAQAIGG